MSTGDKIEIALVVFSSVVALFSTTGAWVISINKNISQLHSEIERLELICGIENESPRTTPGTNSEQQNQGNR
jgi:hypothetical protein